MKNKTFLKFTLSILIFIMLFSLGTGCGARKPEKGVFYTSGLWDIPPAFHGNPWAPGGENITNMYIYEPLFVYNPVTKKYIDRLGKSFEESEDGLTLTVHLKDGVVWQNREKSKFTSKDVQTTYYIGYLKNWVVWKNLEEVECPDENTVVFKWKRASPTNNIRALTRFISSRYGEFGEYADLIPEIKKRGDLVVKTDKDALKEQTKEEKKVREILYKYRPKLPYGTGPFQIARVTASDITLDKFPDYYEADNVKINKVRIMRWASNEVVWSYLIAGEVDAVTPACPYDVTEQILKRNPEMRLITPSDMSDFGLIFNCTRPPTDDLQFREAVAHILDRDMIRQVAYYHGETVDDYTLGVPKSFRSRWLSEEFIGSLTVHNASPEEINQENPDRDIINRKNREKAVEILTKAGYTKDPNSGHWKTPNGKEISLEIVAMQGLSDLVLLAEAASAQLTRFGIKCQIRTVPREIYKTNLTDHNFDMAAENGSQLTKYGHPSISLNRFFWEGDMIKSASGIPEKFDYKGTEIDTQELVKELNHTVDPKRRDEIVEQLAWVINENLPFITCYEKRILVFTCDGKRVTGWPTPDDPIWGAAPGGVDSLFCTMIVKGYIKPVK